MSWCYPPKGVVVAPVGDSPVAFFNACFYAPSVPFSFFLLISMFFSLLGIFLCFLSNCSIQSGCGLVAVTIHGHR
jgi:hypothetical protein